MDGSIFPATGLDISGIAGQITSIIAARYERAANEGDLLATDRYDVSVDTIYLASLLLMIVDGSGETRGRQEVLGALDTATEVIADLRCKIAEGAP